MHVWQTSTRIYIRIRVFISIHTYPLYLHRRSPVCHFLDHSLVHSSCTVKTPTNAFVDGLYEGTASHPSTTSFPIVLFSTFTQGTSTFTSHLHPANCINIIRESLVSNPLVDPVVPHLLISLSHPSLSTIHYLVFNILPARSHPPRASVPYFCHLCIRPLPPPPVVSRFPPAPAPVSSPVNRCSHLSHHTHSPSSSLLRLLGAK